MHTGSHAESPPAGVNSTSSSRAPSPAPSCSISASSILEQKEGKHSPLLGEAVGKKV